MGILALILEILSAAAGAAKVFVAANPDAAAANDAAAALIKVVQSALAAHQQITGQPIDLSTLQPIDPLQ